MQKGAAHTSRVHKFVTMERRWSFSTGPLSSSAQGTWATSSPWASA